MTSSSRKEGRGWQVRLLVSSNLAGLASAGAVPTQASAAMRLTWKARRIVWTVSRCSPMILQALGDVADRLGELQHGQLSLGNLSERSYLGRPGTGWFGDDPCTPETAGGCAAAGGAGRSSRRRAARCRKNTKSAYSDVTLQALS